MIKLLSFSLLLIFCHMALGESSTNEYKLNDARNTIKLEKFLLEAEKKFTFKNKPIHPGIIESFENWEEDLEEPYTVACDLNMASSTYKYPDENVNKTNADWIAFTSDETGSIIYEYKFVGSLKNKLNIVISKSLNDYYTLHAFEFKIEQGISHKDLKLYNRLVLKSYFQTRLESIDDISINDNDVIVDGKTIRIEREISAEVEGKVYKLNLT
ncbi:MAG: hypothetical protein V4544_02820 [Pseudomonadota bacterium]